MMCARYSPRSTRVSALAEDATTVKAAACEQGFDDCDFNPKDRRISSKCRHGLDMRRGQSAGMSLVSAAILSFGPVLVAIVAAALILPRTWLASYAAFVIVATIVYADYAGRSEDAALRGMFSALFSTIVVTALAAGLVTRWALKTKPPEPD